MKTRFPCTGLAYTVENVTATVQQIELRQRLSKRCDIAGAVIDTLIEKFTTASYVARIISGLPTLVGA